MFDLARKVVLAAGAGAVGTGLLYGFAFN